MLYRKLILLLLPTLAFAQESERQGSFVFDWGVNGGPVMCINGNWTSTRTDIDIPITWGGRAGVTTRFLWNNRWSLEPGLNISFVNHRYPTIDERSRIIECDQWSIAMPVVAGYRFHIGEDAAISPLIGIELIYLLSNDNVSKLSISPVPEWKRYDLRCLVGAGYMFDRKMQLQTKVHLGTINQCLHSPILMPFRHILSCEFSFSLYYYF